MSKTASAVFSAGKIGTQQGEIELFLSNNRIAVLANELFNLANLTVLSMRTS